MGRGWDDITGRLRLASLPDGEVSGRWDEHRMLVLSELQRLRESNKSVTCKLESISTSISALSVDVAKIQVKASIWGLIGGMIPIVVAMAMMWLKG